MGRTCQALFLLLPHLCSLQLTPAPHAGRENAPDDLEGLLSHPDTLSHKARFHSSSPCYITVSQLILSLEAQVTEVWLLNPLWVRGKTLRSHSEVLVGKKWHLHCDSQEVQESTGEAPQMETLGSQPHSTFAVEEALFKGGPWTSQPPLVLLALGW